MGNILPDTRLTDVMLQRFIGKYIVINIINSVTTIQIYDGNQIIYTICTGAVFEPIISLSGVLESGHVKWQQYYYPSCLPGDYDIELGHELYIKMTGLKSLTMTTNSGWRITTGEYP
jgi:hypothetical protein